MERLKFLSRGRSPENSFPAFSCWRWLFVYIMIVATAAVCNAQKDVTASPSNSQPRGRLCCPSNHFFEADNTCTPFTNSSLSSDNPVPGVTWEHRVMECPTGYQLTQYNEEEAFIEFNSEGDTVFMKYVEVLIYKKTADFCAGLAPSGSYVGATCTPNFADLCSSTTCVQKCCDYGEVFSFPSFSCEAAPNRSFSLEFRSISGLPSAAPPSLTILHAIPNCPHHIFQLNPEDVQHDRFYLTKDGLLYRPAKEAVFQEGRFCLDHVVQDGATEAGLQLSAFVCGGPGLSTEPTLQIRFYAVGAMLSILALSLTILCNNLIPKLRAMQDLCQLCHMISLLVGEVTLFIGYLFSSDVHNIHCVANGLIGQFALLGAFFWLNVMCFDIHEYVRSTMKCVPRNAIMSGKNTRFMIYSIYAWGCPLILTVVTGILQHLPDYPDYTILRPGFGVNTCWLYGDLERLTFFYIWIAALFVANIFLLGNTAYMLYKAGVIFVGRRKSTFEEGDNRVTNRRNVEKFWQSFSLFSLMALCWVTEILSWQIPPEYIWIPTDIINTLQGFFVFVFFMRIKKKRELVVDTVRRAVFRVSETARKISRSECSGSSGPVWYYTKDTRLNTSISGASDPTKEAGVGDEKRNNQAFVHPETA